MVGLGGILWLLPWPFWGVMCAVCETVAFALQPQDVGDEPADATDAGLRIGCGAFLGFAVGASAAFTYLTWTNGGLGYFTSALVGAVVGAALALRFGDKFFDWVTGSRSGW